jgi:hypothetical protein
VAPVVTDEQDRISISQGAELKLGQLKEQKNIPGVGGKNEKEGVASLGVAFGRLNLRRMCNDSRYRGRYTEPRESREARIFRIGLDSDRRLGLCLAANSLYKTCNGAI